jgi:hypothetical protein
MTGEELRQRIQRLGITYTDAAALLGLSRPGLYHQLRDECRSPAKTMLLVERLENDPARCLNAACRPTDLAAST